MCYSIEYCTDAKKNILVLYVSNHFINKKIMISKIQLINVNLLYLVEDIVFWDGKVFGTQSE